MTAVVVALAATVSLAFQPIPKASARALGVTRGKSFKSGLVFVNGKLIPPPYVVERWGTGIRINQTPVTGQIIDWNDFLKTQTGVKVVKDEPSADEPAATAAESAPAAEPSPAAEPAPAPAPAPVEPNVNSLDDLFDDDDDSKPAASAKPAATPAPRPAVVRTPPAARTAKPHTTVSYQLDGAFEKNDSVKAMLRQINQSRTEIDKVLRSGGFICFGESYPRVSADSRTLSDLLEKLPELQKNAADEASFISSVHAAGLVYLNETLMRELYRNRIDYLQLRKIRQNLKGTFDFL